MTTATWNGTVIAESDDIVTVEGNAYFPREAVRDDVLRPSDTDTVCPWKGPRRSPAGSRSGRASRSADPLRSGRISRTGRDPAPVTGGGAAPTVDGVAAHEARPARRRLP